MQTRILAIGFLANAGWGQGRHAWARVRSHVREMLDAVQTRRLLAEMDTRMMRDIGISPAEAQAEAARWPWDLEPSRETVFSMARCDRGH